MNSYQERISELQQFFEVGEVETTIPNGMCTSLKVDLDGVRKSTTLSDEEREYIGIPTLRHHDVVAIR